MNSPVETTPVEDNISKVNDELSVGENMDFQRRWWRFEKIVWSIFLLVVVADLSGLLGRGYLAKAEVHSANGGLNLRYERIERMNAPSIMTVEFSPAAVQGGRVTLWVNDVISRGLGNQRIIPQPEGSAITDGGLLYTFAVHDKPGTVSFALQPSGPGMFPIHLYTGNGERVEAKVYVLP